MLRFVHSNHCDNTYIKFYNHACLELFSIVVDENEYLS